MQMIFEKVKQCVIESSLILQQHQNLIVHSKTSHQDVVTQCDKAVEAFLREKLSKIVDGVTFIGEENGQKLSDSMFIIDPIDGTTNFCNMKKGYTISVAYYKNKNPKFGIVYDVKENCMYSAFTGLGAFVNDKKISSDKHFSKKSEALFDASLSTMLEYPFLFDLFKSLRGHRSCGCASLAIIEVALGQLDLYISKNVKVWDYAAATIFLHELNGCWTLEHDFFSTTPNFSIFARNKEALEWVKK